MLIHNISHEMDSHHQPAVTYQNYSHLQGNTFDIIQRVHQQLSSGKDHQFSSPLFYLSIVLHKILPRNISKIIVFDIDLIIDSDIVKLFALFDDFSFEQAIGIARENQPVYQNVFWEYRKNNPKTRVGEPPPDGLTGFNSGVVLLDLHKLQQSSKYNVFFTENKLITLVKKYHFQGHLGDQDFFTLLSFESEELFYILPCGWNRQLCTWWKRNGFSDSFDLFYNCSGPVHIWHGNCKTSLLNYTSH
ncbi:Xyloside xylosyltransferase 1 [Bulinus truncatus]|nr:Xyloside xylosyltransferase 1 [Bulinus truncatus]